MIQKDRVKIFVDGSNFFHYCKSIGIPTFPKFNLEKLMEYLADRRIAVEKSYYIGVVSSRNKSDKSLKMMSQQMKLFSSQNIFSYIAKDIAVPTRLVHNS